MKDQFQFRQFTVRQEGCAMKVGTDGVLLGAWARGGRCILDVGCGTGLIALMMAQRFSEAEVDAIDLDEDACLTAQQNAALSPFASRTRVFRARVQDWKTMEADAGHYDAVVCNPPFYNDSLTCPDHRRTVARHTTTLTFAELMEAAARLLTETGEVSVVVPVEGKGLMDEAAVIAGLFPCRTCLLRTTETKPPRRALLSYTKVPKPSEYTAMTLGDDVCRQLTARFYL